jgi:two-component system, LuxR family, response regulator FixJ
VHNKTVFIVDDDAAVRDSLALLLSLRGYSTVIFSCAEDLLRVIDPLWRGCVVVDIKMPGMSGLDLQAALAEHPASMPVIIITGHGDIAAARQAFKAAAVDFLEKPFDDDVLVRAIERAFDEAAERRDRPVWPIQATLSAREREVMQLVVDGYDNRQIGSRLGISARTVEVHKARLMAKLGVRSLADLIRLASQRQ